MIIEQLPVMVKKNGFNYRALLRGDKKMLYSRENVMGVVEGYEVFKHRLRCAKARAAFRARVCGKALEEDGLDKYECYPSDEEFGIRAWCYRTLEDAEKKFLE